MQWLQLRLALSILVVIHELGHFCFARLFKVRVEKFYMFFNPKFSIVRAKKINGKWQVKFFAPNVESTMVPVLDAMGNEKKDEKGRVIERPMTDEELAALPEEDWRRYPDNTEWGHRDRGTPRRSHSSYGAENLRFYGGTDCISERSAWSPYHPSRRFG